MAKLRGVVMDSDDWEDDFPAAHHADALIERYTDEISGHVLEEILRAGMALQREGGTVLIGKGPTNVLRLEVKLKKSDPVKHIGIDRDTVADLQLKCITPKTTIGDFLKKGKLKAERKRVMDSEHGPHVHRQLSAHRLA